MQFFYKQAKRRVFDTFEPIPVGEVVESDWAEWADTVGFQESEPMDFQSTDKLDIRPMDGGFLDVFASVTKKCR
jgi:hypothetical protein